MSDNYPGCIILGCNIRIPAIMRNGNLKKQETFSRPICQCHLPMSVFFYDVLFFNTVIRLYMFEFIQSRCHKNKPFFFFL